jgi:hypothetical protein
MIFSCVVPFKRKRKKNSGFIAATLYIYGEFFKEYLEEGGVVCIFFLSFFLLAVERENETKAQTFRYRSLLSEQNQNVLIWSAYYWNKSTQII